MLVLSQASKYFWVMEISSGGEAQDDFKCWFITGGSKLTAGLHHFNKCDLYPAQRVSLMRGILGIDGLKLAVAAPGSEMLRQSPLQGVQGSTHSPSVRCHQAVCPPPRPELKF